MTSIFSRFRKVRPVETPWDSTVLVEAPLARLPARPVADRPQPASASFRHLRTGRGNILVAGASQVEMGPPGSADALVAIFPDSHRQVALLMAPDMRQIEIRGDGLRAVAVSAFRLQTETPGMLRLRHPLAPQRFVGATQAGVGGPDGWVIFDSVGHGPLDRFEAMRLDISTLSPSFLHVAAEICAAVARPFRALTLLERLRGGLLRPELAEPLIRVLPREELAELARLVLENPDDLMVLRHAMAENPWFGRVLPELSSWHARRRNVSGGVLQSPASDEYAGDPMEGYGQAQAGLAVTSLARLCVRPTQGACLLSTVRNEGAYLLEWLAYHRSIGFSHAFIYTNENFDHSTALLEALAGHGIITLVHNQPGTHCGPQYKMYAHALCLLPHILDYRWAALIDADEFIGFDKRRFRDFNDVLAWHETQPVDALAMCWTMFCAGAGEAWRDAPTLKRFTRREKQANVHVKSLIRPAKFWNARAHYPHASLGMPFVYRSETGALHHAPGITDRDPSFAAAPSAELVWVNHYCMRTAPELLWKLARGHADWKEPTAARQMELARSLFGNFVRLASRQDLVEDRRILACAEGMEAELKTLRTLPGVAEAEARTKAEFQARLPLMARAFLASEGRGEAEPAEFAPFRAALRASMGQVLAGVEG